jgi:isopenicillin N synthase-like dioxygenase
MHDFELLVSALQRWPSEVQDFKQVTMDFFKTTSRLAQRVLAAIARGFRLTVSTNKKFICVADVVLPRGVLFTLQ